ncbi:hypothetical protein Fmac_005870 [Flemingia macrophylla]|uniref:Uncharacterized protein n=1 Tax=Flemingia macrophylla TaxID=520843 RepID=A0ABD1NBT5_9FABA
MMAPLIPCGTHLAAPFWNGISRLFCSNQLVEQEFQEGIRTPYWEESFSPRKGFPSFKEIEYPLQRTLFS